MFQLQSLRLDVWEVDEEPRAHVPFQTDDVDVPRRPEVPHHQVTVLEEAAPSDLLGIPGGDQLVVEVVDGDVEAAVDRLGYDCRVEVLGHRGTRHVVER